MTDPEEQLATTMQSEQMQDLLHTLDLSKRRIIYLSYYLGYTQTQIAAETGMPLGTVKTRNRAALRELKQTISAA